MSDDNPEFPLETWDDVENPNEQESPAKIPWENVNDARKEENEEKLPWESVDDEAPPKKKARSEKLPWESVDDDEERPKKKAKLENSESGSYEASDASESDYEHMELGSEEFTEEKELDIAEY